MIPLVLVVLGLSIDDGGGDCPGSAAVVEALRTLTSEGPPERVELRRDGAGLHVRLLDPNGAQLAERTLAGNDCAELAHTAAVLIAAWRTEVAASTPKLELPPRPPKKPLDWDVAAGALVSFAGSSIAFGGEVAASLGRRGMARFGLYGMDLRSIAVGSRPGANARFTRAGLEIGPQVRFRPGRFVLDLHAEMTLALLYLDSVGFATTNSATAFDLGLGGGGRAAVRLGPIGLFLGVSIQGWPITQEVRISGPQGGHAEVPRFETWLTLGLAIGHY